MFQVIKRRIRSVFELEDAHLDHVDLFGWVKTVVDRCPEFVVHLDLNIVEVIFCIIFLVFDQVMFGYVVGGVFPVLVRCEIRQFFSNTK